VPAALVARAADLGIPVRVTIAEFNLGARRRVARTPSSACMAHDLSQ